jgi:hypothetical protein
VVCQSSFEAIKVPEPSCNSSVGLASGLVTPAALRCALYMASLSAITHNPILRAFHTRLLERGKKFKVSLTAVMRKLLIALNSALKNPNFQLAS